MCFTLFIRYTQPIITNTHIYFFQIHCSILSDGKFLEKLQSLECISSDITVLSFTQALN